MLDSTIRPTGMGYKCGSGKRVDNQKEGELKEIETVLKSKDMTLAQLRELELRLRSAKVQYFYASKDQKTRDRFASLRNELSVKINKMSNAQLQGIAEKL